MQPSRLCVFVYHSACIQLVPYTHKYTSYQGSMSWLPQDRRVLAVWSSESCIIREGARPRSLRSPVVVKTACLPGQSYLAYVASYLDNVGNVLVLKARNLWPFSRGFPVCPQMINLFHFLIKCWYCFSFCCFILFGFFFVCWHVKENTPKATNQSWQPPQPKKVPHILYEMAGGVDDVHLMSGYCPPYWSSPLGR